MHGRFSSQKYFIAWLSNKQKEEAHREGENNLDLSKCQLESFIAFQYARRLHALQNAKGPSKITHCVFVTMKPTAFRYFRKHGHVVDLLISWSIWVLMINRTENALGQKQTDSHQYVLFFRHRHPCVSQSIRAIRWQWMRSWCLWSRGVTRLDYAKKQVWQPHVRTWGLSEGRVLFKKVVATLLKLFGALRSDLAPP